jgi:hypothetical protein
MIIDILFCFYLICDVPEAWQTGLNKPVSMIIKNILIFNNHLLIVIVLFVGWFYYFFIWK